MWGTMEEGMSDVEVSEPAILLRIQKLYRPDMAALALYDTTRGVWAIDAVRCRRVRFALAIVHGVVKEVYAVQSWHPANSTAYVSGREIEMPRYKGRWEFIGKIADPLVRWKYLDQPISPAMFP